MTMAISREPSGVDHPRRLRELLGRAHALAAEHEVGSVMVGFAAPEGDRLFPDFVAFVEAELRVEDALFRMTRERALLLLADCDLAHAEGVVERLRAGFRREFPTPRDLRLAIGYLEVPPGADALTAKQVLPAVFAPPG